MARRTLLILLSLLAVFLFGALAVLSGVSYYLAIDSAAYLTEEEVFALQSRYNASHATHAPHPKERIPRIIHQTWKTDILPDRWRVVSQGCKDLMPDYEYMLWTDESSRKFIEEHYVWFLNTFDGYKYPIQRADAIRYFILYHYGGIYMDLDIGCLRRMDPLLHNQVVLPKTIPVGVSNDLMFSEKGHPFMEQTIRKLISFDHNYIINYPTVMFSTGPMFVSAQYGLYTSSHPLTPENPGGDVRILPKSLYGKNAKVEEAPNSFFTHHYGSSWHADDAAFITFLGRSGMRLMWIGFFILVIGLGRLLIQANRKGHGRSLRRRLALARYDLLLPRSITSRNGNYTLNLVSAGSTSTTTNTSPTSSPTSTSPPSPTSRIPLLPFSLEVDHSSTANSSATDVTSIGATAVDALRRAGDWARGHVPGDLSSSSGNRSRYRTARRSRFSLSGSGSGIMFFLPAFLARESRDALSSTETSPQIPHASRSPSRDPKRKFMDDLEASPRASEGESSQNPPPPPYGLNIPSATDLGRGTLGARSRSTANMNTWAEWPNSPGQF